MTYKSNVSHNHKPAKLARVTLTSVLSIELFHSIDQSLAGIDGPINGPKHPVNNLGEVPELGSRELERVSKNLQQLGLGNTYWLTRVPNTSTPPTRAPTGARHIATGANGGNSRPISSIKQSTLDTPEAPNTKEVTVIGGIEVYLECLAMQLSHG